MSEPSIFSKIVSGKIPSHKVYEDGATLAFMDIHPVTQGHVLVIPKKQVEFVWDLDDDTYQAVMATTQKVALRLREVIGKPYVSARIVGVDVPHAHVQLIPFTDSSELAYHPDMNAEPDHGALAVLAERIRF